MLKRHLPRCSTVLVVCACSSAAALAAEGDFFIDIAADAGVRFVYDNGMTGKYWFPEIMGGGVGLLDYDGDGLLDIYLVQGGPIGQAEDRQRPSTGDRLFRNASTRDDQGRWQLRFVDVTEEAGIAAHGYGMGVAVGDYDADGHPDIYVLNFGDNQLWRNNGDGSFSDRTAEAGVNDPRWSVSASFADLDGSGHLDLVVVNYADYSISGHKECRSAATNRPDYCSPSAYPGVPDSLFRNLGNGRFEDASRASGIGEPERHGLGVISADLNDDGLPDIYVANDGDPNSLWLNQGGLRFVDEAFLAGSAVNADGKTEAGMGVDAADYDRSGTEDLFVTHMRSETNTLYRNDGEGWFSDVTATSGLGVPSLGYTGFGTAWVDIDNDGWLDLVIGNGAVVLEQALAAAGSPYPYHQQNQAFLNDREGRFNEVSGDAGAAFAAMHVSRGIAAGDLDNDGRTDLVIANIDGPAQVLLNQAAPDHHWLGLRFLDAGGKRELVGATAWLLEDGKRLYGRRSRADGSYASANDPRVLFGLGSEDAARNVRVRWPDGQLEDFRGLSADAYHSLRRGSGTAMEAQ